MNNIKMKLVRGILDSEENICMCCGKEYVLLELAVFNETGFRQFCNEKCLISYYKKVLSDKQDTMNTQEIINQDNSGEESEMSDAIIHAASGKTPEALSSKHKNTQEESRE